MPKHAVQHLAVGPTSMNDLKHVDQLTLIETIEVGDDCIQIMGHVCFFFWNQ